MRHSALDSQHETHSTNTQRKSQCTGRIVQSHMSRPCALVKAQQLGAFCADGLTDMTGLFPMLILTAYNLLFLLPFPPVNIYSK